MRVVRSSHQAFMILYNVAGCCRAVHENQHAAHVSHSSLPQQQQYCPVLCAQTRAMIGVKVALFSENMSLLLPTRLN